MTANQQQTLTTPVNEVCVVKRCLIQSLSHVLNEHQRKTFLEYINECSELASRMTRRASLCFLFYVIRRQELGHGIPDFEKATDTYFIDWIKFGLSEFQEEPKEDKDRTEPATSVAAKLPYPKLTPSVKYKDGPTLQTAEDKLVDQRIYKEITDLFGDNIGPTMRTIPKYFSRIVGHLGMQFGTAVKNCLVVNFFAKLKRVCKYEVARLGIKDFSSFDLLIATCKGTSAEKALPEALKPFVDSVRGVLGLQNKPAFVIDESTSFDTPTRFAVHWLLQQRLTEFGRRKLMLSPVFQVRRQHIRLDATHLALLMNDFMWTPEVDKVAGLKPADRSKCPTRSSFPDQASFKAAKAAWNAEKAEYDGKYAAYKDAKANLGLSPLAKIQKDMPVDPEAQLLVDVPVPVLKRPVHLAKDDPVWTKERRPELQRQKDAAMKKRSLIRQTEEYIQASKEYKAYEEKLQRFGMGFFRDFKDRNPKLGWAVSGSVVTDGVSLCVTYERTVQRVNKTCQEVTDEFVQQKKAKRKAAAEAAELPPCDDYDVDASTCFGDALILGIDPGRVCLVTIICIDPRGVKTMWRLTRGQYHNESGILKQNKLQSQRYRPLAAGFASLTDNGGALRASSSDEVRKYVLEYRKFEEKWFTDVALKRRESRASMQRYIGKQRTLASFFSRVRKEAEQIMAASGMKRIDVAYGACGPTMAATGRGELAVPTTGTYKACVNAFTKLRKSDADEPSTSKHSVSLENEEYTSQKCWYTGKAYEKVYKVHKIHDNEEKEYLYHTTDKKAPIVGANEDVEAVLKKRAEQRRKASKRRGGSGAAVPVAPIQSADARDALITRHIDVRGLLFCPESRMFFARDDESARAIAGLRCIRLAGLGRPSAFRRKQQPVQTATEDLGAVQKSLTEE